MNNGESNGNVLLYFATGGAVFRRKFIIFGEFYEQV